MSYSFPFYNKMEMSDKKYIWIQLLHNIFAYEKLFKKKVQMNVMHRQINIIYKTYAKSKMYL